MIVFTRSLPQKELRGRSVITFSFSEYWIIWWFTPCIPYIFWKHITLATSNALFWPSTTKYQPVPQHTDPLPPSTNQFLKEYQLTDFCSLTWRHINAIQGPSLTIFLCVHCTRFGKQFWKHCFVQRTVRWASSDPSFVPRNMVTTSRVLSTTMLIENVKTIAEFFSKNFPSYYEFPSILKNLNKNLNWRASKFNKFGKFLRFSVI